MKLHPITKWLLIAGGAGVLLVILSIVGFVVFFGAPEARKEKEAILFAQSLTTDRMDRLISDSRKIIGQKSWDEESGFPPQFQDLRPFRIYTIEDEVVFMTYKCYDTEVSIVVRNPKSESASVILRTGLDANYNHADKILYKK